MVHAIGGGVAYSGPHMYKREGGFVWADQIYLLSASYIRYRV